MLTPIFGSEPGIDRDVGMLNATDEEGSAMSFKQEYESFVSQVSLGVFEAELFFARKSDDVAHF